MFSYDESDSSCPNCADVYVREAPTNYRRNPPEQVKASDSLYSYFLNSDYSDEYYFDYDEYSSDPDLDYTTDTFYVIIILASVIAAHAPLVHSNTAYSPSSGTPNQNMARVTTCG
jgi:hypothetical protein